MRKIMDIIGPEFFRLIQNVFHSMFCVIYNNYLKAKAQGDGRVEFIDGEIVSYDEPFGSACGDFEKIILF